MEKEGIHSALVEILKELKPIKKEQKNQMQGFMYRGIDAVYTALNPLLAKHGVYILPEAGEVIRDEVVENKKGTQLHFFAAKFRFNFCHQDGSSVSACTLGEAMDSGDKACNKAMSVAMKYAIFQVFCIPTEELADPDSETHELGGGAKPRANQGQARKQQESSDPTVITQAQRKRLYAIAKNSNYSDEGMKAILLQEFKLDSSSKIKKGKMYDEIVKRFETPADDFHGG